MSSVPKPPITASVRPVVVPCEHCHRCIEAMWLPQGDEVQASWSSNLEIFQTHCHECIIKLFAPNFVAEDLTSLYRQIHAVSTNLWMGFLGDSKLVGPDASKYKNPARCPTLTMSRRKRSRKADAAYSYVEEFSYQGVLPPPGPQPHQESDFSFYPVFRLIPDPDSLAGMRADIFVAFNVWHSEVSEATLHLRLHPYEPTLPYQMLTFGWDRVTPTELGLLNREGMALLQLPHDPGGRESLEERQVELRARLFKMADEWNATYPHPPKNIGEFLRHFNVREQTLRGHLKAAQFGTWRNYRNRLLGGVTTSRQAQTIRL